VSAVVTAPTTHDDDVGPPISRRAVVAIYAFIAVSALLVVATAIVDRQATTTLAAVTCVLILGAWHKQLLAWPTLVAVALAVILFVPMRRYTVAGGLPFALEPYRVLIAVIFPAWIASALIDSRTQIRSTGLEAPAFCYGCVVLLSLITNPGRVSQLSGEALKAITFLASFFGLMYLVTSATTSRAILDRFIKILVIGGGVVAFFTMYEWQSGNNVFNQLDRLIPLLTFHQELAPWTPGRGSRPRAYASAQHAIALGAMLVMMLPLCVYLWRRTGKFLWMGIACLLVMGALATGSRTAVIMLVVSLIMFLRYKRKATLKLLPYLLPLLVVVQIAMPGTLGTFKSTIFPSSGSVLEQEAEGDGTGTGRLEHIGPGLRTWGEKPFFGQGYGTRMTSPQDVQASGVYNGERTLDNQWLGSLLEVGLLGVLCLIWLFVRALRRLKYRAKRDDSDYGWLLTALATGIAAYSFGMFTYDAFSFIQVTLVLFIYLGLAAAALRLAPEQDLPPVSRVARSSVDPLSSWSPPASAAAPSR
jgi:O-antigen ligase